MPHAEGDEADLVDTLRREGALHASFVAEADGDVVGHIAFSPARCMAPAAAGRWFGLGPLAVSPHWQRRGIGSRLVRHGLDALLCEGAAGCVVVGHPQYYLRLGFVARPDLAPADEPAEFYFMKRLNGPEPLAPIAFHPAFHAQP